MEPPPIPLIKEKDYGKSDKYFVKMKLRRYPTCSMSDLYEFKMSLFDHGDPEHFIVYTQIQYDSCGNRNFGDGCKDLVSSYTSPWEIIESV